MKNTQAKGSHMRLLLLLILATCTFAADDDGASGLGLGPPSITVAQASPGPIGSTTPNSGAFTTLTASGLFTATNATDASSVSAAAAAVTGGLGVAKRSFLGTIGSTFTGNVIAGVQSGAAAVSGQVGENLSSILSTYTNYTTTATNQQVATITLTPGDWNVYAFGTFSVNSATVTTTANAVFNLSTVTASVTGSVEGQTLAYVQQNLTATNKTSVNLSAFVNVSTSTAYFLNTQSTFTLGNPQFVGSIYARRAR